MEPEHHAAIAALQLFLLISIAQKGQGHAVSAQGGLHHIGDEALVGHRVDVLHILPAVLLVLLQVIIGAVGNAPQLPPAKGEAELKVGGGHGIMGELLCLMVPEPQVFRLDAKGNQPIPAEAAPVFKPLHILPRLAEELQLHLLKLPRTEDEVAGGDLIPEGFANLRDTQGQLAPGGAHDVLEVHKNALGGFRAQVDLGRAVLSHPLMGFEHHVELADGGEILLPAAGAGDGLLLDVFLHLLVAPAVRLHQLALFVGVVLDQLIRPEAGLAGAAVHERVVEAAHMA